MARRKPQAVRRRPEPLWQSALGAVILFALILTMFAVSP